MAPREDRHLNPATDDDHEPSPGFDVTKAHPARIYDYWLGRCFP